jgi:hypothetical protein
MSASTEGRDHDALKLRPFFGKLASHTPPPFFFSLFLHFIVFDTTRLGMTLVVNKVYHRLLPINI